MMSTRGKRTLFRVLVIAGALVISILGAELALRKLSPTYRRLHDPPYPFFQKHPTLGHSLIPGYAGNATWGIEFRVNGLGFRGPEIIREKAPGTYRALILGDSNAMGSGLAEESLAGARLSEKLAAGFPRRKIEVINAGVGGYDIGHERRLLEEEGLSLSPDAVAVIVCLNDVPGVSSADLINPLRDLPVPGKHWLVEHSGLAITIQSLYNRIGLADQDGPPAILLAERDPSTVDRIDRGFESFGKELGRMVDLTRQMNVGLVLVLVPHAAQFDDPRARFIPQKRIGGMCQELGASFVDMAPDFAALPQLPYFFPDPVHPSPRGHELIAERIMRALSNLPPARPGSP